MPIFRLRAAKLMYLIVATMLAAVSYAEPENTHHPENIETWNKAVTTHPAGTTYTMDNAIVARYPMRSLDAANGGGLSQVQKNNPGARMEWALSIIGMGMSEFKMTTLSGMPAAIGTAETYIAWGGVAGMMTLRGVIPSPNVSPPKNATESLALRCKSRPRCTKRCSTSSIL